MGPLAKASSCQYVPSMRVSHSKLTLATALAALALFSCTRTGTDKSGPSPEPHSQATTCETSGTPEVRALYTAEGVLLWEEGMNFPRKNIFYDAIEVHGVNLCAGQFTIADGYTRARPLPYSIIDNRSIRVAIPWGLERITQSLLFRTDHSFTRVDLHVVPVDALVRQIFVREIKSQTF